LEKRLTEIKLNLRQSEDSLRKYQEISGIYDAKEQIKVLVGAYSTLETELITKQIEESVLRNLLDKNSPQLNSARIQVEEFKKKLDDLKNQGEPNGLIQPISKIPKRTLSFLRYFRDVEINTAILEFIVPLYEQSKFDEQKDLPVLQVVDYAIPPVKRSYPKRTVMSFLIAIGVFITSFLMILIKENEEINKSEKAKYIRANLFRWKPKK
jgi:capsule polysaccharide export protein KpsE/RkpR